MGCGDLLDHGVAEFGHAFGLHVAVLELPLVVGFEQDGADEAGDRVFVRKDANDVCPALHLPVQPFERIGRVQLGAVLRGKGDVGEHVRLGVVHAGAQLGPACAQLVGDVPPGLDRGGVVGL